MTQLITSNWNETKAKLKYNFKHLHLKDKDLRYTKGKEEELIRRLQKKLGNNKEEVVEIISKIQKF